MAFLWNSCELSKCSGKTRCIWPVMSEQRQHAEALSLLWLHLSALDCHALCRHFMVGYQSWEPGFSSSVIKVTMEKWCESSEWAFLQADLMGANQFNTCATNESKQKQNITLKHVSLALVLWWSRCLNENTARCRRVLSKPTLHSSRISGLGNCLSELTSLSRTLWLMFYVSLLPRHVLHSNPACISFSSLSCYCFNWVRILTCWC